MSQGAPTIWMNVTTSANWQRPPVGIVRVERELCAELSRHYGERFRQCIWQDGRFVEWIPKLEHPATPTPASKEPAPTQAANKPALPPIYPILNRQEALMALAQGLLSLMPGKLQPYVNRLLHALRPPVFRLLNSERTRRLLRKLSGKTQPGTPLQPAQTPPLSGETDPGMLFARGDVLISVGLDWDYPYYKQFYALRKHRGMKVVTCCYDLIPVLYPQYCVNDVAGIFTSYFLEVADGSDLVLCISKQSEKDLNELLERTGGARPPTHVFPLGDNIPVVGNDEISPAVKEICREKFILFVSTIERRKNHEVLYRAYHLLCAGGKRPLLPKLVFVGMPGWGVSELMKDIELDPLTRDLIVRMSHVSDAELRSLYESASFCVFPSLYEGWGLPVGEALSLGKAVLASDRGSLPEVGGDLVRYIDPWSPHAWAEEIYRIATDDAWRREWEQKAKKGYCPRTWAKAADTVYSAIGKL